MSIEIRLSIFKISKTVQEWLGFHTANLLNIARNSYAHTPCMHPRSINILTIY